MPESSRKSLRKKIYIDQDIQGKLIIKHVIHWCFYMSAILLTVAIWASIRNPTVPVVNIVYQSCLHFSPAVFASLFLLPLFLFDHLKESHRVVGPIHRIRKEMKMLSDGGDLGKVEFRQGDHWEELAQEYNRLASIVVEQRHEIEQFKIDSQATSAEQNSARRKQAVG